MLHLMGQKDPQDPLNLDSKLREKFPRFIPDFVQYKRVCIEPSTH